MSISHFLPKSWFEKPLQSLIIFSFLFPYVPSVIPKTDTQPTFLLLVTLSVVLALVQKRFQLKADRNSYKSILLVVSLFAYFGFALSIAIVTSGSSLNIVRIISFLQFIVAAVWAYRHPHLIAHIDFKKVLYIYVFFSCLFILTDGAIESILIRSRALGHFTRLQKTGRGISTLSPEPSFFALHIFNLYIIRLLVLSKRDFSKNKTQIVFLSSLCWIVSLSGYGVLIFGVVIFTFATIFAIIVGILLLSFGNLIPFVEQFSNVRAIKLILLIIKERRLFALLSDISVSIRFSSFNQYIDTFKENYLFGDGFSFSGGGGLISVVVGLGLMGIGILLVMLLSIFFLRRSRWQEKVLLFFWMFVNTISGSIGVPTIGIILGLVVRRSRFSAQEALTDKV